MVGMVPAKAEPGNCSRNFHRFLFSCLGIFTDFYFLVFSLLLKENSWWSHHTPGAVTGSSKHIPGLIFLIKLNQIRLERPSFVWDIGRQQVGIGIKSMITRNIGVWGTSWYSDLCLVILTPHFVLLKGLLSLFKPYFMRTSHPWMFKSAVGIDKSDSLCCGCSDSDPKAGKSVMPDLSGELLVCISQAQIQGL